MFNFIFINGKMAASGRARISVNDRGFLYGDGLYETMRSYKGSVFMLDEHIDRLFHSLKVLKYNLTFDGEHVKEAVRKTINRNNLGRRDAYIKVIVTRGINGRDFHFSSSYKPSLIVIAKNFRNHWADYYTEGIKIISSSVKRPSVGSPIYSHKLINYFENIYAKDEASYKGAQEAIFLTGDHLVLEGASSNIFFVKGNTVYTPPLTQNILPGITRKAVVGLCRENRIRARERKVHYRDFINADEIFVTGSIGEVVPVREVDRFEMGGNVPGKITSKLMALYRNKTSCSE
ncbi:MAG: aminotransferase class IV [Actinomycetota bacterium]|nr:aminotransferase class IV [Actinomycetota bacterium]